MNLVVLEEKWEVISLCTTNFVSIFLTELRVAVLDSHNNFVFKLNYCHLCLYFK